MRLIKSILGASLLLATSTLCHAQSLGFNVDSESMPWQGLSGQTLGVKFNVKTSVTVTGLATISAGWKYSNDPLFEVGLWTSEGTLLTSTVISFNQPLLGDFRTSAINPLHLEAGSYIVGSTCVSAGHGVYQGSPAMDMSLVNPLITWEAAVFSGSNNYTLEYPTAHRLDIMGYWGGNIVLADAPVEQLPVSAVPEPSTYGLLGSLCLGGLGWLRRQRRKQN